MTNAPASSVPTPYKLTAEEFIDIITLKNQSYYSAFYKIHEKYGNSIIIKDVEITEDIHLPNEIISHLPIIIINGVFNHFRINGGTFQGIFEINGGIFRSSFEIHDGTFQDRFFITGGTFENNFVVRGGTFQKQFYLQGGTFQSVFEIHGGTFQEQFSIDGSIFQEQFWISNGTFPRGLVVYKGTFQKQFYLQGGTFQLEIMILGGTYKDTLSIYGTVIIQRLYIYGGSFENNFSISGQISELEIGRLDSKISLIIYAEAKINFLSFKEIIPKDSFIRIGCSLYKLSFTNVQNFGTIVLNESTFIENPLVSNWLVPPVKNSSDSAELIIQNSDLGKTTFMNCDLSGFGLHFKSSKITDVFVTGTQMPNQIITIDENGAPDYRQQQLGYSQIKKIYEARGDRVESNRYYAQEMDAYQTTLSWSEWNDFWEKLNLRLNKFSTNYGQSWQRGLGTTLLVSAISYILYCAFLGYLPSTRIGSLNQFWIVASYFLEFLNPIHKADYVLDQLLAGEKSIPDWALGCARATESLSRILIAYFVYQLIQAFRKHGKSSG